MYKRGDYLENNKNSFIISEVKKDSYKIFILNGFYEIIIDLKGNILETFYRKNTETSPESFLIGYNLGYEPSKSNRKINFFENIKFIGNLNDKNFEKTTQDKIFQYFYDNNKKSGNNVDYSFNNLSNLVLFSKSFDRFYENNFNMDDKYKVGDIFSDNLQRKNFYSNSKNDFGLNENYWVLFKKTSYGFFAVNIESMLVFHFFNDGNIDFFVNDIDNRFEHKTGKYNIKNNSLNEISNLSFYLNENNFQDKFYLNKNNIKKFYFYQKEKINKNHFYEGLKLIKKVNLDKKQKSTIFDVVKLNIKNVMLNYNFFINSSNRNFFFNIEKNFNNNVFYNYFDNSENLQKNVGKYYYYERYSLEQYMEKLSIIEDIIMKNGDFKNIESYVEKIDKDNFNNYKEKEASNKMDWAISLMKEIFGMKYNLKEKNFKNKFDHEKYKNSIINEMKLLNNDEKYTNIIEKSYLDILDNIETISSNIKNRKTN